MRTLRLLGRDMENGILRRCVLFILPLLFAVSQTRELHAYLIELADGNILLTNGTFADYLLFAMKGMEVFAAPVTEAVTLTVSLVFLARQSPR